jgi:hypothetical protein
VDLVATVTTATAVTDPLRSDRVLVETPKTVRPPGIVRRAHLVVSVPGTARLGRSEHHVDPAANDPATVPHAASDHRGALVAIARGDPRAALGVSVPRVPNSRH